jgi:hypothetical protein
MPKRQRIDSASAAVSVMAASANEITPPEHVRMADEDWPYWRSVIAEFARSEWTDHQLEVAAFLARTMSDLEREQWELRKEGAVVYSEKGTPVANPRKVVVQMHASSILSLRRSLSLHARAQGGEARDVAKRRGMAKDIEGGHNPMAEDDDGLLARPSLQ